MIALFLVFLLASNEIVCAQKTSTSPIQDSTDSMDISIVEDPLELFFLEVQEFYFDNRLVYCDNLEKIIHHGKKISPYWSDWVMKNKARFKVECDNLDVSIFYNDTLFASYKYPFNLHTFSTYMLLSKFVKLFDENDFVVLGTNAYEEYAVQKRNLISKLQEQYGYEIRKQKNYYDREEPTGKEYPILILFVFDNSGLRLHPLFADFEQYIDGEYKQQLVLLASQFCSKYNAKKMIFPFPVMQH